MQWFLVQGVPVEQEVLPLDLPDPTESVTLPSARTVAEILAQRGSVAVFTPPPEPVAPEPVEQLPLPLPPPPVLRR